MRLLLRWIAGLIVWAAGFNLLYALHGIGCGAGWDGRTIGPLSVFRWALVLGWLAPATVGAWLAWRERHPVDRAGRIALACAGVGLTATVATGAPVLFFPACL